MSMKSTQPEVIHQLIVEIMKRFPEGISECQIRRELAEQGVQPHALSDLRGRIQELDDWFIIERLVGVEAAESKRQRAWNGDAVVELQLRAAVLYRARARCGRCRRSVEAHGVTLLVRPKDSRLNFETRDPDDFWAICEECCSALTHLRRRTRSGSRPKCCGTRIAS